MTFGTKKSEAPDTGDVWIKTFQTGETQVRFIEEMDDWIQFREHFNVEKHWFPCTQDGSCPGCTSDDPEIKKRSTRYATNVYLSKTSEVRPYKIPVTLANKLETRAERNSGTITNRDYVIIKSGVGLKTEYDVDNESKFEAPLDEYRKSSADIESLLVTRFNEMFDAKPEPEAANQDVQQQITIDEKTVRNMSMGELEDLAADAGVDLSKADGNKTEMVEILISALG